MAINRQKLKLLYLMRMLEEETDAERGLTMAQIIGKLEALGISAERKSIYRDIEALREFGVDVRTYQRAPVEYAVEHRAFAFAELQLLVDAVQSSRFLTQRKSDALVEGVKDGTVDAIVTDHAPHNDFEKNAEFELAPFGMIGLVIGPVLSPSPGDCMTPGCMRCRRRRKTLTSSLKSSVSWRPVASNAWQAGRPACFFARILLSKIY